ncbi:hypothetical protein MTY66_00110 [Mycolicibacterium sp. TY66]|uniref:PIN-like domain-containing protein n=1 Tax=Mycobacteriaceae TaxID=1762 RepID=UPI001BB305DE|nr:MULTISPECIES: hypothetical protein [unclassified Mycolicibacterium]MDX1877426.1 hypothetical protein [Mycolicibacterium sp. 141076]BCI78386.1 hypothetical protein MTY66_00110 [Mycolicibacterium sp. TY66]BCJ83952.1 hypothetical protein MTY81_53250 [Mycolicibacterium sp. TY81]
MKNAEVRFYFDADILGLAHVVCRLRADCTYPADPGRTIKRHARPPCEIPQRAKDREWIPAVAERGWVAITRDADIQTHLSLLQLVKEYGLRLVTLSGKEAVAPWEQLEILMPHWRKIEEIHQRQGPMILGATRTSLRYINIDAAIGKIRDGRQQPGDRNPHRSSGPPTLF